MTSTDWTELTVKTPLATLNVRHTGTGAPIVFLHNLFLSAEMWEDVAASLSDRHHVILIDGPGHGASTPLAKPFVMADFGRAVVDVMDTLGVDKAVLAGSSWGGVGALEIALDQPERAAALVVMNATASGFTKDQKGYFKGVADQIRAEGFPDAILDKVVPMNFGKTTLETRPDFVAHARAGIASANKDSVANTIVAILAGQQDYALRFEELDLPILLLWGAEDHALPVDPYMNEFGTGLPGARSMTVPGAGHAVSSDADPLEHYMNTLAPSTLAARSDLIHGTSQSACARRSLA